MSSERVLTISCSVRRDYGAHQVEFAVSEVVTVNSGVARRNAYNNLYENLSDQIALYETVYLPHVKLPQNTGQKHSVNDDGIDVFKVDSIEISYQGEKRIKVRGGRWLKHGVPIYPDSPIYSLVEDLDYGTHESFKGWTATAQLSKGIPKRITGLVEE